jgi:hypothetical protein
MSHDVLGNFRENYIPKMPALQLLVDKYWLSPNHQLNSAAKSLINEFSHWLDFHGRMSQIMLTKQ